ncbi:MAG: methylmalonyl-CoA mutase family protein [Candidatus Electryonea clarkiae]|nr:methylmalonyl-CoA mutase family protein [Candidatus Electryonea clarkiae]MDP8286838.1 methylmalonyl-CoA mutase family protein [Candidatus Electryonea clarkiae]
MANDSLKQGKNKWEADILSKTLAKRPERKKVFTTDGEYEIERVYSPEGDLEHSEYMNQLGFPGMYPFTRGVQPTMYRGKFWTMRQYAGFGTAEDSNKRYKYLLSQGTTGLSVAFDLPTQIGYDSDHHLASGEVGKVGVAIDSLADMEVLLEGIPLDKISTSMTINSTAAILLAMYTAMAGKQNVPKNKINGTIQNDILKEYIARGTYRFPPKPSMRLITDIFAWCQENTPSFNTISISGYHIREAGSTAEQEIAFTLANARAYIEAALSAGLEIDSFAPRLAFFFNSHSNLFEEAAKFRAARRIYARMMKETFKAKNPLSTKLRFHTQTAGSTLTAQQIDNNVVRTTIEALAAVLGGTQSLHTNSRDEALALPTEASVKLALRTQQVIAYEAGVTETIDPLAGSYYVEKLTDEIEGKALEIMETVQDMGGSVAAIENQYFQTEIARAAYRYEMEIENGNKVIVGVNKFIEESSHHEDLLKVDPEEEKQQIARVQEVKRTRRQADFVQRTLDNIKETARGEKNLMPVILDAVEGYMTLGEICMALEEVWGTYKSI